MDITPVLVPMDIMEMEDTVRSMNANKEHHVPLMKTALSSLDHIPVLTLAPTTPYLMTPGAVLLIHTILITGIIGIIVTILSPVGIGLKENMTSKSLSTRYQNTDVGLFSPFG